MKKCHTCQTLKDETEFNRNKCKKDGLNTICRECSKVRSRRYYKENYKYHKKQVQNNTKRYRQGLKNIVDSKRDKCIKCGETDKCCLDFHHLRDKIAAISTLVHRVSKKLVLTELEKCVVLCSNCHKKLHAGRFEL